MSITFGGNPVKILGTEQKVGNIAPDFTVVNNDLEEVHLSDYDGKVKVLSALPSLDTGVCDLQTKTFNRRFADQDDVVLLTISVDLPFAQARWCGNSGIENAITLSDHRNLDFGMKYGLVIEDLRLLARAVFVLDQDNKIQYIEYVPEVSQQVNFEAAEAKVEELLK